MNLSSMKNYKRLIASVGLATLMTVAVAAPAFAAESDFTTSVTGGEFTLTVPALAGTFGSVGYNAATAENSAGSLDYSVQDDRGTGEGWIVQIVSSELAYTGASDTQTAIAASAVSIVTAEAPVSTGGQDITGVTASGDLATLGAAVPILTAVVDSGMGTYTQGLDLNVEVPAESKVGSYAGTLTVTSASETP